MTTDTPSQPFPPPSPSPPTTPPQLTLLSTLSSPTITRAWQSSPHPHTPLLATATADRSVAIWSLRDFRLLSTITGGHKRSIRSVAWKDAGKGGAVVLATGSFDSNTGIWTRNEQYGGGGGGELDGPTELGEEGGEEEEEEWAFSSLLTGPDSEIKSVAFSPTNPALLATSSRDKSVWVWEDVADSGAGGGAGGGGDDSEYETVAVLAEHTGDVKCVAWHPGREVLASGSYDDTVRLWRDVEEEGDWCCVGVLVGHAGTVWGVAWEGLRAQQDSSHEADADEVENMGVGVGERERGGVDEPRLASCSDDLSIRIWRKISKDRQRENHGPRLPSIIRPPSSMETWIQDATLPQTHVRSIYSIAWSSTTGLLVSCGGDGAIYVYKEQQQPLQNQHQEETHTNGQLDGDVGMNGTEADAGPKTEWVVVAQIEAAHDEFEVNHVCWARRQDRDRRGEDEEVIVSSGDDGTVRVWAMPEL